MADNRGILHVSQLDRFKEWLVWSSVPFRPGKGFWQALQVQVDDGAGRLSWEAIFKRKDMPEHYTVSKRLVALVRAFHDWNRRNP